MLSIQLPITNASGLHARPAALFVRTALAFRSDVRVRNLARAVGPVDAKSILGVLGLGVSRGVVIEITAEGEDEAEALTTMRQLVESGIGEGTGSGPGSPAVGGVPPLPADA
jgi:phosphotransferase system HPr (HPr) family protein